MICPPTRIGALEQFTAFMEVLPLYARDRNKVVPGHAAVSRLSPAIRHRLIDGVELSRLAMARWSLSRIEKWLQEVWWRQYWKAWLGSRPEVWSSYRQRLEQSWPQEILARSAAIEAADSGNPIIDAFARELSETGYLHNHARMWIAAWWVHEERLPWELGAAWFFRHLLDGDPAANTLSWRWVAGLQTPGKTYLARRSNLEKYLDPEWLAQRLDGLAAFESPEALLLEMPVLSPPCPFPEPVYEVDDSIATGLWIHEEDLSPETTLPKSFRPQQVLVSGHASAWLQAGFPTAKQSWLTAALDDVAGRAEVNWKIPPQRLSGHDLASDLTHWADQSGLQQVVAMRPPVGPLSDEIPGISTALERHGIRLLLLDRPADVESRPYAKSGFFKFWERVRPRLGEGSF
ncbi:MAG: DNA photolyase [Verrucomicrobiales bacterium VVV1]|nr:MAG: DNA photolyase [Verrucomicrobiales bacterium VVV1]